MVVAIRMSLVPNCAISPVLSSPNFPKSQFLVLACLCKTHLTFRSRLYPSLSTGEAALPSTISISKRISWSVRSSVDVGELDPPSEGDNNGGTRLGRLIQALRIKISARVKEIRRGFPMKVLFFLMGFYSATAFATVIGQTGDWDILSAGLAVLVVEGIGALMYRSSFPLLNKIKSLITMFNFWKAGLSMGLFLDAFKYELDNIFGFSDPFKFEIDIFPSFL